VNIFGKLMVFFLIKRAKTDSHVFFPDSQEEQLQPHTL